MGECKHAIIYNGAAGTDTMPLVPYCPNCKKTATKIIASLQAELAKVQDELKHRREAHDATISGIVALERELAEAREREEALREWHLTIWKASTDAIRESGAEILHRIDKQTMPQAAALLAELEDTKTYLATAQRQLDKIDETLPNWQETGSGRIETIAALLRRQETAERVAKAYDAYEDHINSFCLPPYELLEDWAARLEELDKALTLALADWRKEVEA